MFAFILPNRDSKTFKKLINEKICLLFILFNFKLISIFFFLVDLISFIQFIFLRHALPLFTSLLNIVFSYDPVGYGLPYNYLMFTDSRENLVEVSCQMLCVILESNIPLNKAGQQIADEQKSLELAPNANLFISYLSRIHRDEVDEFKTKNKK